MARSLKQATADEKFLIENAWMGVDIPRDYIKNPIEDIPEAFYEEPHIFLTYMLGRPEYFAGFCKYVLNLTLLPYQCVVLKELWDTKFPIYIATRGGAKSWTNALYALLRCLFIPGRKVVICGASFRQSKIIFEYIDRIWTNAPLLRDMLGGGSGPRKDTDSWRYVIGNGFVNCLPIGCLAGNTLITTKSGIRRIDSEFDDQIWGNTKFRDLGRIFHNGVQETFTVRTKCGYEFRGTKSHKMRVLKTNGCGSEWKRVEDIIIGDKILIDCSEKSFSADLSSIDGEMLGESIAALQETLIPETLCLDRYTLFEVLLGIFNPESSHKNGDEFTYRTSNKELIGQLRYLLLNFGILSKSGDDFITTTMTKNSCNTFIDTVDEKTYFGTESTYDLNIPEGHEYCANGFFSHNSGEKLRGQRSNDTIIEEAKSVPIQIFEEVISGFSAVSSDPVGQAIEQFARERAAELGIEIEEDNDPWNKENQIIMSGTAYYQFNHFYDYWNKARKKILSVNNPDLIREVFPQGPDKDFNPKHYSIIRLPYTLLPPKFMDAANMSRTKSQINKGIFFNEYEAVFSTDSDGFFRRSLIEFCTAKPGNDIDEGEELLFDPKLRGDKGFKYFMGIDPAMTQDNLCITILEDHGDHRRIVYCWTTNKQKHRDRLNKNFVRETDYFGYVARKIRDLMARFDIELILMDSQGGGHAVLEALRNRDSIKEGEQMIFEVKNREKPKDTDRMEGIHIVELIQFSSSTWTSDANHGLKKDLMERKLLFPYVDGATMAAAVEEVGTVETPHDNIVEMYEEIEAMKDELSTVQVSHTQSGREHFAVPDDVVEGKKKRGKKDRYSALLMANYGCRKSKEEKFRPEISIGGFAGSNNVTVTKMYYGNDAYNAAAMQAYSIY